ncbi:MAG TPA: rhomboid family intramembrane serine protease [Streptosporangiaceae bacterium]|nr:rhomboid family intramembrane serine protease [Streptosporangiaceae bacterium]
MTSQSGSGTPSSGTPAPRAARRGPNRRAAEIDVDEARKAFFLMVGFIGLIWVLQIANWADHYGLDQSYGILPRSVGHLGDIFTAPFLHFSWDHIEGNSGPLFVFGLLAAYRGVVKFLGATLIIAITSGMAVWLFQGSREITVGASGLIFGYFGYVLTRGILERNLIDALAAIVIGLSYAYILTVAIPGAHGVSWIGHLGGLIGGIASGWIFRTRRSSRPGRRAARPPAGPGSGSSSQELQVTRGHPRADLYKELDDMGL